MCAVLMLRQFFFLLLHYKYINNATMAAAAVSFLYAGWRCLNSHSVWLTKTTIATMKTNIFVLCIYYYLKKKIKFSIRIQLNRYLFFMSFCFIVLVCRRFLVFSPVFAAAAAHFVFRTYSAIHCRCASSYFIS